jgi:hypothetical protein
MSGKTCAGSLPDNIQLIQTNTTETDSLLRNNQISDRQNHLIQFTNETIPIDNTSIHTNNNNNIKLDNINQHRTFSKRSKFFFILKHKSINKIF